MCEGEGEGKGEGEREGWEREREKEREIPGPSAGRLLYPSHSIRVAALAAHNHEWFSARVFNVRPA